MGLRRKRAELFRVVVVQAEVVAPRLLFAVLDLAPSPRVSKAGRKVPPNTVWTPKRLQYECCANNSFCIGFSRLQTVEMARVAGGGSTESILLMRGRWLVGSRRKVISSMWRNLRVHPVMIEVEPKLSTAPCQI